MLAWPLLFKTDASSIHHIVSGTYAPTLVILSYLIAVFASYVALDFAGVLRREKNNIKKYFWLIGGSFVMGAGVWSMHFVGMLAFIMPMPMEYNPLWTGLSMLAAILSSALAFFMIRNDPLPPKWPVIFGGIIMGFGISTMHYMGMGAMLHVTIYYRPFIFTISILIGIFASEAALWLLVKTNQGSFKEQTRAKILSAFLMGAAICGMHYTGMAAAIFQMDKMGSEHEHITSQLLALYVIGVSGLILITALIISTYKQVVSFIIESEKDFLNAVLNNISDGVIACDNNGEITIANQSIRNMPGFQDDKLLKIYLPNREETPLSRALAGEIISQEELEILWDCQKKYFLINGQPLLTSQGKKNGAVITFHDITERKKLEEELAYQATHDVLTSLPNRMLLMDRVELSIHQAKRNHTMMAVLFVDLDHFKVINDSLGHTIGDELLLAVSKRLRQCVREIDTVSRIGGDEFVILLNSIDSEEIAASMANKINTILAKPFTLADHIVETSGSIGISIYPNNSHDASTLLKQADIAMYRSKKNGRNTFCFYTKQMNIDTHKRVEIENELKIALEQREFELYYQPVFDVKQNHITSVEALLRWNHPTRGVIMPLNFIKIAEDSGLMIPLGYWIIEAACQQLKQWNDLNIHSLHMAINISPKQLQDSLFLSFLKNTIKECHVLAKNIELEITENVIAEEPDKILTSLKAIKKLGCQIALDNFGMSYSKLSSLEKFPLNKMKIDTSNTLKENAKNNDLQSIMMTIFHIASSMKMKITTAGAENDLAFLRFNRCNEVQGFYFCEPLNAENCTKFLLNHLEKHSRSD